MKLQNGESKVYEVTMDTHMGVLTGEIRLNQESTETVSGQFLIMGKTLPFAVCVYEADVYRMEFEARGMTVRMWVTTENDSLYGFALAPHHQVMELHGQLEEAKL